MTRINIGINPKILTNRHLIAEHREIKRIPNTIKSGKAKVKDIPEEFTLGKGHVKFFYNKLGYLQRRYHAIYMECMKRGLKVTPYYEAFADLPVKLNKDYQPTTKDIEIILGRLVERDPIYANVDRKKLIKY